LNIIIRSLNPLPAPEYRDVSGFLDEGSATLIQSEVRVENSNLGVLLTAALSDDFEAMNLQLLVAVMDVEAERDSAEINLSSLTAGIHWGDYHENSPLNDYGQAKFPPLPLAAIVDETGQIINSDLQLVVQPAF
jgi:hypothetical protein